VTCDDLASPDGWPALRHLQGYPFCCGGFAKIQCLNADGNLTGIADGGIGSGIGSVGGGVGSGIGSGGGGIGSEP